MKILRGAALWPAGIDKAVDAVGVVRDQLGAHSDATKPTSSGATMVEARFQLQLAAVVIEYLTTVRESEGHTRGHAAGSRSHGAG